MHYRSTLTLSFLVAMILALFVSVNARAGETWLDEFDVGQITSGYANSRAKRSISDKTLSVGGVEVERGIGVHAPSSGSFSTEGATSLRFTAKVGVDDSTDGDGSVVFQVFGDGEKLFDSGLIKKGDAARDVDVDLAGKEFVRLEVTDGGDGKNFDHADWCAARFVHGGPAPQLVPHWATTLPCYQGGLPESPGKAMSVCSPTGKVEARVGVAAGRLVIEVKRDGKNVLEPSPLGVTVDGVDIGECETIGVTQTYATDMIYPNPIGSGTLHDHCRGLKIEVRPQDHRQPWTLDIRTYDDGVAWRYLIPGEGIRRINGEATAFVLPEGVNYWSHNNTVSYEASRLRISHTNIDEQAEAINKLPGD